MSLGRCLAEYFLFPVKSCFPIAAAIDHAIRKSENETMLDQVGLNARCASE